MKRAILIELGQFLRSGATFASSALANQSQLATGDSSLIDDFWTDGDSLDALRGAKNHADPGQIVGDGRRARALCATGADVID